MIIKNNKPSKYTLNALIEAFDFVDNGITILYATSSKLIKYSDIKSLDVIINIPSYNAAANTYHLEYGYNIVIIDNREIEYIVHTSWTNLKELFCIVYYSRQIRDFTISYRGTHKDTKKFINNRIQEYINNNYTENIRIKFFLFIYTPTSPFKIFLCIFLFLIIFTIAFITLL